MAESDWLAERFEENRLRLQAVAYRLLGSLSEAEDAVQEAWIRLSRATDADEIENLGGWLTTVVSRVCLDRLRARKARREEPLDVHVPDPVIGFDDGAAPEHQALLADAVGLALQVVLDALAPAERLAFVLHDMFDVPFEEIAPLTGRSPEAARQLASRARRRVRGSAPVPDAELVAQRRVVDAFPAAARGGDLDRLVAVLDPDVVVRFDGGRAHPGAARVFPGVRAVARGVLAGARARASAQLRPALVNGAAGIIMLEDGRPLAVWGFTVAGGRIVENDVVSDPERLHQMGPVPR